MFTEKKFFMLNDYFQSENLDFCGLNWNLAANREVCPNHWTVPGSSLIRTPQIKDVWAKQWPCNYVWVLSEFSPASNDNPLYFLMLDFFLEEKALFWCPVDTLQAQ